MTEDNFDFHKLTCLVHILNLPLRAHMYKVLRSLWDHLVTRAVCFIAVIAVSES